MLSGYDRHALEFEIHYMHAIFLPRSTFQSLRRLHDGASFGGGPSCSSWVRFTLSIAARDRAFVQSHYRSQNGLRGYSACLTGVELRGCASRYTLGLKDKDSVLNRRFW